MSLITNALVVAKGPPREHTTRTHMDMARSELLTRRAEHSARLQSAQNQSTTLNDEGAIDVGLTAA